MNMVLNFDKIGTGSWIKEIEEYESEQANLIPVLSWCLETEYAFLSFESQGFEWDNFGNTFIILYAY